MTRSVRASYDGRRGSKSGNPYRLFTMRFHSFLIFTKRWALLCQIVAVVACCQSQSRRFVVRVVVPPTTPKEASLFITGNTPALGEWDPGRVRLQKESDSVWRFAGEAMTGAALEFKITRGTWLSEAIYVDGTIPQNTTLYLVSDTTLVLRPVTWNDLSAARKKLISASGITGSVRYHRGLRGVGLNYQRDAIVWLPPSYGKDTQKRYPVLYMHDGQNVFDPSTSFLGSDWRADEVADSMIKAGAIEEIIIVGVNNTPDRIQEYSDTKLGRSYAMFIVERLKPMIDSLYRTKPGSEHTAVMGSSMGGLISLLFVWWHPEVFSMAGCLSTAIGPGRYDGILREIEIHKGPKKPLRFYVDVGDRERQLIPGYNQIVSTLERVGYQKGSEMEFVVEKGAEHNEIAWAHRLWRPLKFMFGH
jgi:predicted alpha/beta superfamily hydrolase